MAKKLKKNHNIDEEFEAFLKDSYSTDESLDSSKLREYAGRKKKEPAPWWLKSDESDTFEPGTGKSFLKKKPEPKPRKSSFDSQHTLENKVQPVNQSMDTMSKDSLDGNMLQGYGRHATVGAEGSRVTIAVPGLSLDDSSTFTETNKPDGLDTCTYDEEAEKNRFFKEMEQNADSTIDFSRLNRDLDKSDTMKILNSSSNEHLIDDLKSTGGHHNGNKKERMEESSVVYQQPSMLSKVALLDSIDTTLGTAKLLGKSSNEIEVAEQPAVKTIQFSNTVKSGGGTGALYTDTSMELDALHKAYQEVGMSTIGTENGFQSHKNSLHLPTERDKTIELSDTLQPGSDRVDAASFGLKQLLPADSGEKKERTLNDIIKEVEELQKKSQIDVSSSKQGYYLSPVYDNEEGRGFQLSPARADEEIISEWFNKELEKDEKLQDTNKDSIIQLQEAEKPIPPKKTPRKSKARSPDKGQKAKPKFSGIRSSGYGQQKQSKENLKWSPINVVKQKVKGSEVPSPTSKLTKSVSTPMVNELADKQLMASVESFASYIQDHFGVGGSGTFSKPKKSMPGVKLSHDEPSVSGSLRLEKSSSGIEREKALIHEVKDWQEQWKEERRLHAKAKVDATNQERELKRQLEMQKLDQDQQIFKLKQENFVLAAKVADGGIVYKTSDSSPQDVQRSEQVLMLEKEIQEQEKLLAGYQQENERLYQEVKRVQVMGKATEEKMFKENQKLHTEIMSLKGLLERKELELRNKGIITSVKAQQDVAAGSGTAVLGAGKIAQLEAELKQAKKKEDSLNHDMKVKEQSKRELELHIEKIVHEKEELGEQVHYAKLSATNEIKDIKKESDMEIDRLNRKIRWYAENQELLDRDTNIIRQKNDEIRKLKDKIEEMKSEKGEKRSESQTRTKERTADAKKIQDLQRQVKEMEAIMKRRNPNSIQALVWAASAAPDPKSPSVEYLENRIKHLESELEEKDGGNRSLRVLEQKYTTMKFQYEERIKELEVQLSRFTQTSIESHPHTHATALQKELDTVRHRSRGKIAEKEAEIERLNKEFLQSRSKVTANMKNELQAAKDSETELQLKVKGCEAELGKKDREILTLQTSLERIRKEKEQIVIDSAIHNQRHVKGLKESQSNKSGQSPRKASQECLIYEPETFRGLHISDVIREKEDLQLKVDRLQLEVNQFKKDLCSAIDEKQAELEKQQKITDIKINELKQLHTSEIIRVKTSNAVEHSASKVAELQSKVDAQQIMLTHLREKLSVANVSVEQLPIIKIKETTLENQIKQLLDELKEAKRSHTPEMRHYDKLMDKIHELERKHKVRESELKQIIFKNKQIATEDMQKEVHMWRNLIDIKNRELERFRLELDSILDVLEELRRQGVVIPSQSVPVS